MENNSLLQDTFGRKHDYLRISITEHCNLRCTYCMPEDGISLTPKSHLMTADEIVSIAQTFVNLGVTKIRLTGGEPLVRKDARDIISRLGKLGVNLTITTNGILVSNFIETFKEARIKTREGRRHQSRLTIAKATAATERTEGTEGTENSRNQKGTNGFAIGSLSPLCALWPLLP